MNRMDRMWPMCCLLLLGVPVGLSEEAATAPAKAEAPVEHSVTVEMRTWENQDGFEIKAILVEWDGENVTIESSKGKRSKIAIASLSDADRAYLKSLSEPGAEGGEEPAVGPEAPSTSLRAGDDVMDGPPVKPVAPVKYGPAYWSVGKGVIASQVSGKDVSNAHVADLGNIQFTKKPGDGLKMVAVAFPLAPVVADRDAVKKLTEVCEGQAQRVPGLRQHLELRKEEKKKLRGKYRLFDMAELCLVAPDGTKFEAIWAVMMHAYGGVYLIEGVANKPLYGGTFSRSPWHKTCLTAEGYTGLLEVNKKVVFRALFGVPEGMGLDGWRVQVGDQKPVGLNVTKSIGARAKTKTKKKSKLGSSNRLQSLGRR